MNITQKYIPVNTKRHTGKKLLGPVKFIVAHDTANDGATALNNVDYYIRTANEEDASAHSFVDAIGVIECIPLDERACHVRSNPTTDNQMFGVNSNDYAIGVELCYSTKGKFDSVKAYNNYVEYIASLCKRFSLNPKFQVVGHYKLDPERRTDPLNAFGKIGKTWDMFIQEVQLAAKEPVPVVPNLDCVAPIKKEDPLLWRKITRFFNKK